jgi:hypothetical protein
MADSFKELTILRNSNRDVDTTNKVGLFYSKKYAAIDPIANGSNPLSFLE